MPFFSIVIPTRNRGHLIPNCIQSVLNQTFKDFEILLIDNDITQNTFTEAQKFFNIPNFKYFRTGTLSMADNWEFGYANSNGEYFLIIEDKMRLKSDALQIIFEVIQMYPNEIYSWHYDLNSNLNLANIIKTKLFENIEMVETGRIIDSLLNMDFDFFNLNSPRSLNSCISKEFYKLICNKNFGRLFVPISPDFTSAFQQLMLCNYNCIINIPLVTLVNFGASSGFESLINSKKIQDFIITTGLSLDHYYNKVAFKLLSSRNSVLNDYMNIAEGHVYKKSKIDLEKYTLFIYDELMLGKSYGGDLEERIYDFKQQVEELIKTGMLPTNISLKSIEKKYSLWVNIRNRLYKHYNRLTSKLKN